MQCYRIEHGTEVLPYGKNLEEIQRTLDETDLVVLFNGKFDLAWLRRYGITLHRKLRVWDCQLFEFMKNNQTRAMPKLETVLQEYLIGGKDLTIEQYWEQGISTELIPWEIVESRVVVDVEQTAQLYLKQYDKFCEWTKARQNLYRLHCADLLILQEIEYNGLAYNTDASLAEAGKIQEEIDGLVAQVQAIVGDNRVNLSSTDHKSAILYGGTIVFEKKVHAGVFKTGKNAGSPRYRWERESKTFPRLVAPLQGTQLKKEGSFFSTDKEVVSKLKAKGPGKKVLQLMAEIQKREKLVGTYLSGIPKRIVAMNWEPNMVHGTINQTVAVTGRTSSSGPNLQNMSGGVKRFFVSRYAD